jgi:hypothetical protein
MVSCWQGPHFLTISILQFEEDVMKRLVCICAAIALLGAAPAMGGMTGNELKEYADSGEKGDLSTKGFVLGYIMGVIQTTDIPMCIPKGVTNYQVQAVVVKFLKDNPEQLHMPANLLTLAAVTKAWPCPK